MSVALSPANRKVTCGPRCWGSVFAFHEFEGLLMPQVMARACHRIGNHRHRQGFVADFDARAMRRM